MTMGADNFAKTHDKMLATRKMSEPCLPSPRFLVDNFISNFLILFLRSASWAKVGSTSSPNSPSACIVVCYSVLQDVAGCCSVV